MNANDWTSEPDIERAGATAQESTDGAGPEGTTAREEAAGSEGMHQQTAAHDASRGQTVPELWSETVRVLGLWWDELARLVAGRRPTPAGPDGTAGGAVERSATTMKRRLYRSRQDRMIRGVCAGLADYLGIPVAVVRLVFVVLFFTGVVHAVIPYVLLALLVPEAPWEGATR